MGAGVVGVTTAWQLARAGFQVTVVDQESAPALQTSFANGGQISVSHATPWANPHTPLKALQWLQREDAPLLFRWRRLFGLASDHGVDWALWRWGTQFLRECLPSRADANLAQMVRLGLYSRQILGEVRATTGIQYNHLTRGIMHFYTNQPEFASAFAPTARMQQLGCDRRVIDVGEALRLEPALAAIQDKLVGATFTALDESGDARMFTQALAQDAHLLGVRFLFNHKVWRIVADGKKISSIDVQPVDQSTDAPSTLQPLSADGYVLALGSYSPLLVKPLGIDLPIYPAKGYSATYHVLDAARAPWVSLIDDEFKLVYSRLGDQLRVAGTAEFNGFDRTLNAVRCQAITKRVVEVFGDAVDTSEANFWTGLRPMTPSNVPIIGRAVSRRGRIDNLYLNTGHGTLGWTHANGSAKALCDIILGKNPEVEFKFVGLDQN